jgi:hypothetical protein
VLNPATSAPASSLRERVRLCAAVVVVLAGVCIPIRGSARVLITVAMLSTESFDAPADVERGSVRLAGSPIRTTRDKGG